MACEQAERLRRPKSHEGQKATKGGRTLDESNAGPEGESSRRASQAQRRSQKRRANATETWPNSTWIRASRHVTAQNFARVSRMRAGTSRYCKCGAWLAQ